MVRGFEPWKSQRPSGAMATVFLRTESPPTRPLRGECPGTSPGNHRTGPLSLGVPLFPSEIQLVVVNAPDHVTRRKVLATTGGTLAVALAGCGSPGDEESGDADSPAQDGEEPEGGESTADSENDPYAPEDNSTQASGNETVETRGPEEEGVEQGESDGEDEGEAGEGGDGGAGQDDDNQTGAEDPAGGEA